MQQTLCFLTHWVRLVDSGHSIRIPSISQTANHEKYLSPSATITRRSHSNFLNESLSRMSFDVVWNPTNSWNDARKIYSTLVLFQITADIWCVRYTVFVHIRRNDRTIWNFTHEQRRQLPSSSRDLFSIQTGVYRSMLPWFASYFLYFYCFLFQSTIWYSQHIIVQFLVAPLIEYDRRKLEDRTIDCQVDITVIIVC